jgi:hypothetical protein
VYYNTTKEIEVTLKKPDKAIKWNPEKNNLLRQDRGLSFEAILLAMERDKLIDSYPHPRLPHQKIFEIEIDGYIVVVPYVEDEETIFLKTAFHSRKATKKRSQL